MNWKETHSNHSQVQGTNGGFQRGESVVLLLGFGRHEWCAGCEEERLS